MNYNKIMWKRLIPYLHAKNVYDIDISLFKKLGVKYIFCDLDNTLDSYKTTTPSERAIELKEKLNAEGIELIITSNNTGNRVKTYAEALKVRYFSSLRKPFSRNLNKKIADLGLNKEEIILIGDQVVTDISCANGAKIRCILTDKLVKEDQPTTRFNRLFDRPLRRKLAKKHLLRDWRNI